MLLRVLTFLAISTGIYSIEGVNSGRFRFLLRPLREGAFIEWLVGDSWTEEEEAKPWKWRPRGNSRHLAGQPAAGFETSFLGATQSQTSRSVFISALWRTADGSAWPDDCIPDVVGANVTPGNHCEPGRGEAHRAQWSIWNLRESLGHRLPSVMWAIISALLEQHAGSCVCRLLIYQPVP